MRTAAWIILGGLLAIMAVQAIPRPWTTAAPRAGATESPEAATSFEILSHSSQVVRNYRYVVGEARNTSSQPARLLVIATFYDEAGTVIGTDTSHLNDVTRSVPPGETVPFEIMHPSEQSSASYRLLVRS